LTNESTNKFAKTTGYFSNPAGPDGQRFAALGGQGVSVNSYVNDERKAAAFEFIKWFAEEKVQAKWGALGGFTCNINVLKTDDFLKVAPFNGAFAETMTFVKDFTNIPEFGKLLPISQENLHKYIVSGEGSAKGSMQAIADGFTEVLTDAGYIK
jgi:multiple sugar transport system substrate-binding protein